MALNTNNRIFWAVQALGISVNGEEVFTTVHGLQSIGITTTFNLEQVFEIGQIAIYENIEDIPDVEVTLEKVLDGYPLIYHLATPGSPTSTLSGRSGTKCVVAMSIYTDTQDAASGDPNTQVNMSGMFVNSVTYTIPVDGSSTEAVTLVGNNKVWRSAGFSFVPTVFNGNDDTPLALQISGSGGVQRRENIIFNNANDGTTSLLPGGSNGVFGISSSGTNDRSIDGFLAASIQNITVSADLGRDALNELGTRGPYFRFVNFPVEVSCEIEILGKDGDQIGGTEEGIISDGVNLVANQITIQMDEGLKLDLGGQNKLSNVTYGGADAGGGNATITYSYTTFNDLTVTHPQDPG